MRGRDGRLSSRAFSEACLSLLQVAKRLRCSACRGSAVEYHAALAELRALRNKAKIKDFEYTEALDPVCEKRVSNYGLQLRSNESASPVRLRKKRQREVLHTYYLKR